MKIENILAVISSFAVMSMVLVYMANNINDLNVYSYIIISALLIACFMVIKSVSIQRDKTQFAKIFKSDIPIAYWFVILVAGLIAITDFMITLGSKKGAGSSETFWFLNFIAIIVLDICWLYLMFFFAWLLETIVSCVGRVMKFLLRIFSFNYGSA